jgi:hypothetical protein
MRQDMDREAETRGLAEAHWPGLAVGKNFAAAAG